MITKEQYLQALTRVAQYEREQLNIPFVIRNANDKVTTEADKSFVSNYYEKITSDGKICFESNNYVADLYEDDKICSCESGKDCELKTNMKSE
jgi:hypothetical protein